MADVTVHQLMASLVTAVLGYWHREALVTNANNLQFACYSTDQAYHGLCRVCKAAFPGSLLLADSNQTHAKQIIMYKRKGWKHSSSQSTQHIITYGVYMIWTAKRSHAQNVDRCLQHYSPIIRNSISDRSHGHFSRDGMVALPPYMHSG